MKKTAVIMAGGFGERFWPLSRMLRPKQILKLTHKTMNMLQEAVDRISPIISSEDIFIITSKDLLLPIRKSMDNIPAENIIAEPAKRNTAPCLALASAVISAKYKDFDNDEIVTAVLTADHKIEPKAKFVQSVDKILSFVSQNDKLATIGIKPSRAETGYGYIELSKELSDDIYQVNSFREKPNSKLAEEYINTGNFLWNSGMFFWKLSTFKKEMQECYPEIGDYIADLTEIYSRTPITALDSYNPVALEIFERLPSISIDYALLEKSKEVVCGLSNFNWDDVGAWDSLDRVRELDDAGNIIDGDILILDSKNCTVINENTDNFTVTGFGLENLVIITTKDSVMICPKDKAQDVKKIVAELRNQNKLHLL